MNLTFAWLIQTLVDVLSESYLRLREPTPKNKADIVANDLNKITEKGMKLSFIEKIGWTKAFQGWRLLNSSTNIVHREEKHDSKLPSS